MSVRVIPADRTVNRVSERRYQEYKFQGLGIALRLVTRQPDPKQHVRKHRTAGSEEIARVVARARRLAVTLTKPS